MKDFGLNLQELMKKHKTGVTELSKAIDEPAKTIQEWVGTGGRTPRKLEKIKKVAEFFNVSVHELLFGEEDPKSPLRVLFEKTEIHSGLYEITVRKVTEKI